MPCALSGHHAGFAGFAGSASGEYNHLSNSYILGTVQYQQDPRSIHISIWYDSARQTPVALWWYCLSFVAPFSLCSTWMLDGVLMVTIVQSI
jgi:hypothetical protein